MAKITKRAVDALTAQNGKPVFLWDDSLSGFGVKCLPGDTKRYLVKYRTQGGGRSAPQRWLSLGTHGHLTPDQARKLAQEALASVAAGKDPQGAKLAKRRATTLDDVWTHFCRGKLQERKPSTRGEYEAQWRTLIGPKLGKAAVENITRSDADRLHKGLRHAPYRANRVLALISRLMSLSEEMDLRPPGSNPCRYIEKFKEAPRTRFLDPNELKTSGDVMRTMVASEELTPSAANAIRLLLLTGARLNEVLSAEWEWLKPHRRLLELPDSKTGPKPIYLSSTLYVYAAKQSACAIRMTRDAGIFCVSRFGGER